MKVLVIAMKLLIAISLNLLAASYTFAGPVCEVAGNQGANVYVYCPKEMSTEKVAESLPRLRDKYFDNRSNQVHIYIFNNKVKTPKTGKDFFKMTDAEINKFEIGIYDLNKNTGHMSFLCRKANSKKMTACESLIK